jgi:hypothetical protein
MAVGVPPGGVAGATRTIDLRRKVVNGTVKGISRSAESVYRNLANFLSVSSPVLHHNSDRYFSSRWRIFGKKCIHKNRSSPCHLPATPDGISRTLSSSPGPYNSLTNMDVNQIWTTELRHIANLLTRHRQQPRGKRFVPLHRQTGHVSNDAFKIAN